MAEAVEKKNEAQRKQFSVWETSVKKRDTETPRWNDRIEEVVKEKNEAQRKQFKDKKG